MRGALPKVDGGDTDKCEITRSARELAPNMYVEHGSCDSPTCPLNGGNDKATGRWPWSNARLQAHTLQCSDIFRTYDMVRPFALPAPPQLVPLHSTFFP